MTSLVTKMIVIRFAEINAGQFTKRILNKEKVNELNMFSLTFDSTSRKHWQQERWVPKLKMHTVLNRDFGSQDIVEMPIEMNSRLLHLKNTNEVRMVFLYQLMLTHSTDHNSEKIKTFRTNNLIQMPNCCYKKENEKD